MEERKPLGKLLIDKGLLTHSQLTYALEFQLRLPPNGYMPLGKILVELELVTAEQVDEALGKQKQFVAKPIGEILVEMGVVAAWQMSHALCWQHQQEEAGAPRQKIGEVLVQHGYASRENIESALRQYYDKTVVKPGPT